MGTLKYWLYIREAQGKLICATHTLSAIHLEYFTCLWTEQSFYQKVPKVIGGPEQGEKAMEERLLVLSLCSLADLPDARPQGRIRRLVH